MELEKKDCEPLGSPAHSSRQLPVLQVASSSVAIGGEYDALVRFLPFLKKTLLPRSGSRFNDTVIYFFAERVCLRGAYHRREKENERKTQ